ncbi:MAG TPA: hypothetical protein VLA23_12670, partial [Candidatus Limnocylindrales bacterium]|nr:hypothetical protein [Candidatus Limnocylindrales bacterium]
MVTTGPTASIVRWLRQFGLLVLTVGGLVFGLVLTWAGREDLAFWAWALPTVVVGLDLAVSIVRDLLGGKAGVDVIAIL